MGFESIAEAKSFIALTTSSSSDRYAKSIQSLYTLQLTLSADLVMASMTSARGFAGPNLRHPEQRSMRRVFLSGQPRLVALSLNPFKDLPLGKSNV